MLSNTPSDTLGFATAVPALKVKFSCDLQQQEGYLFLATHKSLRRPNFAIRLHGLIFFQARRKSCAASTISPVKPSQIDQISSETRFFIGRFALPIVFHPLCYDHVSHHSRNRETSRSRRSHPHHSKFWIVIE
jgi:hypothetical protein